MLPAGAAYGPDSETNTRAATTERSLASLLQYHSTRWCKGIAPHTHTCASTHVRTGGPLPNAGVDARCVVRSLLLPPSGACVASPFGSPSAARSCVRSIRRERASKQPSPARVAVTPETASPGSPTVPSRPPASKTSTIADALTARSKGRLRQRAQEGACEALWHWTQNFEAF